MIQIGCILGPESIVCVHVHNMQVYKCYASIINVTHCCAWTPWLNSLLPSSNLFSPRLIIMYYRDGLIKVMEALNKLPLAVLHD